MNQPKHARAATRTRYQARVRKALPRAGKALQSAIEAQEAPQSAIDEMKALTRAQRRQAVYILLQIFSNQAAAPELDPWEWSGNGTPAQKLNLYSRIWDQVGRIGFDRRDILSPGEVEERIERALVVCLLEDVDLSGFAA